MDISIGDNARREIAQNLKAVLGDTYVLTIKAVDVAGARTLQKIQSDPLRGQPDELIEGVRVAAYRLLAPDQLFIKILLGSVFGHLLSSPTQHHLGMTYWANIAAGKLRKKREPKPMPTPQEARPALLAEGRFKLADQPFHDGSIKVYANAPASMRR